MGRIEYKLFLLVALWLKPTAVVSNTELLCQNTLDAEVDETVILQCWTEPKMDVSNKVEWVFNDTVDVHLLRDGKPEFDDQGKDYKDITSLFDSELHSGNCSLRLKTKMCHTGRYRCSVRIGDETKHSFVSLTVHPHLNPSDGYQRRDTSTSIPEKQTDGNNTGSTNTLSGGAITGIVTAVIFIVIIFIAGVICIPYCRRFEGVRQINPDAPVDQNDPDALVAHNGPVQAVEERTGIQEEPNDQNEGEEEIPLRGMGDQNPLEQGHL